jgi:peptide/nickel transport system substrate-binding protein
MGLVIAAGLVSACAPPEQSAVTGSDSIVIGTSTSINPLTGLNSSYQTYQYNAFDSLVRWLSDDEEAQPRIATEWTSVDDLTTDFTIRDGVKFHDGTTLTARDVAFSFNEIIDEKFVTASTLSNFESVTALDDSTVRIVTKTPEPLLLNIVAQVFIVPEAAWNAAGGADGFAAHPIGSGPYRITEFDIENSVTFEAFDDYWGEAPATRTVELRYFSDPTALTSAFESGQLTVAHELPGAALQTLKGDDRHTVSASFSGSQNMFQFNTIKAPFNNETVRRAANLAIDAPALIDALTYGGGTLEDGQLPIKGVFGHTDSITRPAHNLDEAKKLLAQAGAEGTPISISGMSQYRPLLEAIGGQLAKAGFRPTIAANETAVWLQQFRAGTDADIFYRGTSYTGVFDADRPFSFISQGQRPLVSDPKWTELYQATRTEMNRDAREQKLIEASKYLLDKNYVLYTYGRPSVGAVVAGTTGADFGTGIMLQFDRISASSTS